MRKIIRKKISEFLSPVFSPASGLLFITLILYHYNYYGRGHELHDLTRNDKDLIWLLYIYSPFILFVNFFRINGPLAGFAAFVTFVVTLLGMVTIEVSVMHGIRRPNVFDILFQAVIIIQAGVLTFRLLKYIKSIVGIFTAPKEMRFVPSPVLAIILLALVPSLTYLCDEIMKMKPHQSTDLIAFTGTIIIYIWKLTIKEEKITEAIA